MQKDTFIKRLVQIYKSSVVLLFLIISPLGASENNFELIESDLLTPVQRFHFNIRPGINVYFAPKLLHFIQHNFDNIFERNGFSPTSFFASQYKYDSGKMTLDDMISNPKTLKSIKTIRYYFRKFFQGIRIRNTHHFDLSIDGIDLSANWKDFGVEITQDPEIKNKITATIRLEADRIGLNIGSFRVYDKRHDFIGKIGGDKVFINLNQENSPSLKVEVPIEIESYNGSFEQSNGPNPIEDGELRFTVKEVKTNIDQLNLKAGWNAPLKMPKVSVSINGSTAYLRTSRVERSIKRQIPNLILGMQESLQEKINNELPEFVETYLNRRFKDGYLDMIRFEPFFAPDEEVARSVENGEFDDLYYPNAYLLGLKFKNLGIRKGHLNISVGTFMEDGKKESNSKYHRGRIERKPYPTDLFTNSGLGHDIATIINIDLINKYMELSCNRGYFKKVDAGTGSPITLSKCPRVYVNKKEKQLLMEVEVEDRVKGFFESKVVRNPIRVRFVAGLKLVLNESGQYNLVLTNLYKNSVRIKDKYIRMKLFRKSVINAAKKMLSKLNKTYKNYTVYENIPLPNTMNGVSFKHLGTKYEKNGYIILYMKTIL